MWQESLRKYNLAVFLKSVEQILYTDLCVSDYGSDSTKDWCSLQLHVSPYIRTKMVWPLHQQILEFIRWVDNKVQSLLTCIRSFLKAIILANTQMWTVLWKKKKILCVLCILLAPNWDLHLIFNPWKGFFLWLSQKPSTATASHYNLYINHWEWLLRAERKKWKLRQKHDVTPE